VEGTDEVADLDAVVIALQRPGRNRLVVDKSTVTAYPVLDVALTVEAEDLGMAAANGGVIDIDVAFRAAAENDLGFPFKRYYLSLIGTFENVEIIRLFLLSGSPETHHRDVVMLFAA
jgi:hypothetical protein